MYNTNFSTFLGFSRTWSRNVALLDKRDYYGCGMLSEHYLHGGIILRWEGERPTGIRTTRLSAKILLFFSSHRARERSACWFPPSPHCWHRNIFTIFLISLIGLVCYAAVVFLGEPLLPTGNSQAEQEATGAGKPWVFRPAGRHRSVFLD